jgi:hypothetical protein
MSKFDPISKLTEELNISIKDAETIIRKAQAGGEIKKDFTIKDWLDQRFLPNCVLIDEEGYTKMCVDALKILGSTAATDYGASRQRDLGQLWADMTRGYLGEYAFQLFMKQKWNIESELGHEKGNIQDFLLTDIHKIKIIGETERNPNLKISIKTTKWNGIWLDIPGDQFNHADVHLLVKVGTGRDHLFAFFKRISVFQDKILKRGQDVGVLTKAESDQLYEELPSFSPIPAYICGFVWQNYQYKNLPYSGKMGRKNYTITGWNGAINPNDLEEIKKIEFVSGSIKFEGIGSFSHDKGYLFNTGNLLWQEKDWNFFKTEI